MTDGERLVWATTFSLALERSGDAVLASKTAAGAIVQLRELGDQRLSALTRARSDESEFLDEIVSIP